MSRKSARIAGLIEAFRGRDLDAHYLGYFECFNREHYYQAHDVLEELWLAKRQGPDGAFYKGLIQLAGAFVHLQRQRLSPAVAVFKLAKANLQNYPAVHQRLRVAEVVAMVENWLQRLEGEESTRKPFGSGRGPRLCLVEEASFLQAK